MYLKKLSLVSDPIPFQPVQKKSGREPTSGKIQDFSPISGRPQSYRPISTRRSRPAFAPLNHGPAPSTGEAGQPVVVKTSGSGAGNGIRTRDTKLGKLVLYQLSYARHRDIFTQFSGTCQAYFGSRLSRRGFSGPVWPPVFPPGKRPRRLLQPLFSRTSCSPASTFRAAAMSARIWVASSSMDGKRRSSRKRWTNSTCRNSP